MILKKYGEYIQINDKRYAVGDSIKVLEDSDYSELKGIITEILDGDDKTTENDTIDIICDCIEPTDPVILANLEYRFSELYGEPKKIQDIILDYVVMSPDEIEVETTCKVKSTYKISFVYAEYICTYLCESIDEMHSIILKEYKESDICIGELLNSVFVEGLGITGIVELYARMMNEIEGDIVQRVVNPTSDDETIIEL